jgi:RND family efflux transporter MFP subunit
MALDKATLDSLKIERGGDASRYLGGASGKWKKFGLAALLAIVLAVVLFGGSKPLEVATAVAEPPSAAGAVLNASGYVTARRIATVASKSTGQLVEVTFEEGAVVQAGQILARLDDAAARAAWKLAAAQREAAQRELAEVQVRHDDALRQRDRLMALLERKLVAPSTAESAVADAAALQARLAVVRGNVRVAEARVAQQQQQLEDLIIRAPFAGVIVSKAAQPGEMVSPISAGGGFTRTGIATVVDMDSREIEVDVNESFINRVTAGMRVEAVLDAYGEVAFPCRVIAIVPTADRQKATVRVRIGFDTLDPRILPDMGVKVRFLDEAAARQKPPQAWVAEAAVVRDPAGARVWTVQEGKAVAVKVVAGRAQDKLVPIASGLAPGTVVVLDPPKDLAEGRAVKSKTAG